MLHTTAPNVQKRRTQATDVFQRIEATPGLLSSILLSLEPADFARAGATCPRWRAVVAAGDESVIWEAACSQFPLVALIKAQAHAAGAAMPASVPHFVKSWRELYIQRVLANKQMETLQVEHRPQLHLPPTSDYLVGVELHQGPSEEELPGYFYSTYKHSKTASWPPEPIANDLARELWETSAAATGHTGVAQNFHRIPTGARSHPGGINTDTIPGITHAEKAWRFRNRQPVFAHVGELNANYPYTNSEPGDKSICWVDLNAETLTHAHQEQLYLSAFLVRKWDGKCATLFANDQFSHGQSWGGYQGVYGSTAETVFYCGPSVAPLESHVYSRLCNCPNRSRHHDNPPSGELKDIALFPCSCGTGDGWKACGVTVGVQDVSQCPEWGLEEDEDEGPSAVDTVRKLLQRLEGPECTNRWA
jgi:hypothetical protein